ncbi:MAG: hypothetical protein GAS50_07120 [Desulfobacterales bacterium]|jgi:hypothetical protein|nr:hypothetical protein [Desulfobacterales bacterium]
MDSKDALIVFEGREIRHTWNNNEWWFVLEDIVQILTDSRDPKQYIQKMKKRDEPLAKGWVQIVHTLVVDTAGGKQKMNCVNTEGAFRIIQSIQSPNKMISPIVPSHARPATPPPAWPRHSIHSKRQAYRHRLAAYDIGGRGADNKKYLIQMALSE